MAVGRAGTILRTTDGGATWRGIRNDATSDLFGVHFTDENTGTVVGSNGAILRTFDGGRQWSTQNSTTTLDLHAVFFSDANAGIAVGESGMILRTSDGGTTWQQQFSGTTCDLRAVYFTDPNRGTVVGGDPAEELVGGTILTTIDGGATWTVENSGATNDLYGVFFPDASTGVVVGTGGAILRKAGGEIEIPSAPILVSPADGSSGISTSARLSWRLATGASAYQVQVATTADFSTTVIDQNGITDTSYLVAGLANNTIYYWRVKAVNAGGTSDWSSVWSFVTIVQLPSQVLLISPANFEIIAADSVRFLWQKSAPQVNLYWFEFATDSLMTNAVIDSTLAAADTTTIVRQLLDNQSYWWRVRAKNPAGWGPFSVQRQFRVDLSTRVHAKDEIPRELSLRQNYPNPFNPSTTIEYTLPQPSHVELRIYDVRGFEIAILVNGKQEAGKHTLQFNAANLPSGIYFYRLRVGHSLSGSSRDFEETKKFILMK
jgi:photosystem II stability/assembly factor-like uncharacterized protein